MFQSNNESNCELQTQILSQGLQAVIFVIDSKKVKREKKKKSNNSKPCTQQTGNVHEGFVIC